MYFLEQMYAIYINYLYFEFLHKNQYIEDIISQPCKEVTIIFLKPLHL